MSWREQQPRSGVTATAEQARAATAAARSPVGEFFAPVQSSAERPGWDRVLIERHQVETWEGEARLPLHTVLVMLRPPRRTSCRLEAGHVWSMRSEVGDVIVVPAGRLHWGAWQGRMDFLLAYMTQETLAQAVRDDGLDGGRLDIDYRVGAQVPELASVILAMHEQLNRDGAEDRLYVDTLGVQMAVHLLRSCGIEPLRLRPYRGGLSRAKMRIVLDYVNAHLTRNIHLAELANLVEMSQFHFLRLFRASSGATPHQYLVQRRVEVAKNILLREDVPLADVAYRLGFADQSHFTRHFRRLTGAPPGRLRRTGHLD